jgi:hypothetical protein
LPFDFAFPSDADLAAPLAGARVATVVAALAAGLARVAFVSTAGVVAGLLALADFRFVGAVPFRSAGGLAFVPAARGAGARAAGPLVLRSVPRVVLPFAIPLRR